MTIFSKHISVLLHWQHLNFCSADWYRFYWASSFFFDCLFQRDFSVLFHSKPDLLSFVVQNTWEKGSVSTCVKNDCFKRIHYNIFFIITYSRFSLKNLFSEWNVHIMRQTSIQIIQKLNLNLALLIIYILSWKILSIWTIFTHKMVNIYMRKIKIPINLFESVIFTII